MRGAVFWTFVCALIRIFLIELAGKKELDNYSHFLEEYSSQLRCIENALDEYFEDAWDFDLDPVSLQVCYKPTSQCDIMCV